MHEAACLIGFVFGSDIKCEGTVDKRDRVPFIEKNAHTVVEFKRLCCRFFLAENKGRDEADRKQDDCQAA
jgi:hypothetical protein